MLGISQNSIVDQQFCKANGSCVGNNSRNSLRYFCETLSVHVYLFVCVEVLRPSQPNGVMSSAVSLPNHTFIGQA